ncbi:hypothetical protein RHSIM_Rhsim01G0006600 [Rhododendron simsii]|uniref:Xyloglucan endotransglucosylase/hydrolase n=1 Tax=Rhododendron simsii TaxID=118357 RepID=A0A834HUW3_RHOSS|nr:hypothetical protein RHSIM_Rhsim01G0006600 [Rhododendron simsii]
MPSFSLLMLLIPTLGLLLLLGTVTAAGGAFDGNFYKNFEIVWGDGRARVLNHGKVLTLSLDQDSGSSIRSKNEYLFGRFDMQIKLVPGNSAGTVTSFYLSSLGSNHDEVDFEFLGNLSGDPYTLHTNIFSNGGGGREQQFQLWFDPTADFHTYSIIWTPNSIILSVDETPIREFRNLEKGGVPYANSQPMRLYASLWNAEYWATRGGAVRTNWTYAPFTASYRKFEVDACVWSSGKSSCKSNSTSFGSTSSDGDGAGDFLYTEESDFFVQESIKWVQTHYMIYNYCTDWKKYPQGIPYECFVAQSRYNGVVNS